MPRSLSADDAPPRRIDGSRTGRTLDRTLHRSLRALGAVFLRFSRLGPGERLPIASSLAGLNVLVYGDLDP